MDQAEFNDRMKAIDRQLAATGRPIPVRTIAAWFMLTGEKCLDILRKDRNLGPYEGPNRFWTILDWYKELYPTQSVIGYDWGPRPMIIRGVVYSALIPVLFNPSRPLDAFRYLPDVPLALRETLDQSEQTEVRTKYNMLFAQSSVLAMTWSEWHGRPGGGLASELLDAGRADLRMAAEYALDRNPGSVLFVAQQAPEKYFKALLVVDNPLLTDGQLRNKFGHNMRVLFDACAKIETGLERHRSSVSKFDYGPEVRYQSSKMTLRQAVDIIDLAHDICHTVALHLLSRDP
jgi:hypothetical protein